MRSLLVIAALVVLVLAALYLGGPRARMQQEKKEADTRLCITQLRRIGGDIDEALLRETNIDLATAVSKIARREGYALLRYPEASDWVSINPDIALWRNQVPLGKEV